MTLTIDQNKDKPTLKIYRADGLQPGWEQRFDSIASGTYFIHEEIDCSENRTIPQIGDRLAESNRFADGEIYERQSNWLVTKVQRYPSFDEESDWQEVVLCSVTFEPIEAQWTRVPSLQELMAEKVAR